jgi:nucleotide-binding universal stress UspA family protein
MAPRAIISYDDTEGDLDALALGRLLARAGAELILAYVRHHTEPEAARERAEAAQAEALLDRGAEWLDEPHAERRVIVNPSTADGLCMLASRESADIVVFGSDYRTAAGHVAPQRSAQWLLECGWTAVALAPACFRTQALDTIRAVGVLAAPDDDAAIITARALAQSFDAPVTRDERPVDLLVVGSRPEAPEGRLMISAFAHNEIENATCPVLVVPRGVPIRFPQLATL